MHDTIEVDNVPVSTIDDVTMLRFSMSTQGKRTCTLLLAHSATKEGLVETGIPQVNVDQLNNRWSFNYIEVLTQEQFD